MHSDRLILTVDALEARFGVIGKQRAECGEHGAFVSVITKHSATASGCPACAEAAQREQDARERRAELARLSANRLAAKLGDALIPKRFQGKEFDHYRAETPEQRFNLNTCKRFAETFDKRLEDGRCLLLLGKPGTGKTHLAAAIADYVIRYHSASAVYRTVGGVLAHVKGSYGKGSEYSEREALASLVEPSLLILDEVGATKQTEFEEAIVFSIINARYEQMLPTIVISNLDAEELPAALGERCVDRLREGGGVALVFNWASARQNVKTLEGV